MKKIRGKVGKSGHIYVSLNRTMCPCVRGCSGSVRTSPCVANFCSSWLFVLFPALE